jgi:hypothetical protein
MDRYPNGDVRCPSALCRLTDPRDHQFRFRAHRGADAHLGCPGTAGRAARRFPGLYWVGESRAEASGLCGMERAALACTLYARGHRCRAADVTRQAHGRVAQGAWRLCYHLCSLLAHCGRVPYGSAGSGIPRSIPTHIQGVRLNHAIFASAEVILLDREWQDRQKCLCNDRNVEPSCSPHPAASLATTHC